MPSTSSARCSWLTGDYPAAAASHPQALDLYRDLGDRPGKGEALINLGTVQRRTGDYPAAAATLQQAMAVHRDLGDPYKQAFTTDELGTLQRLTGDYPAAAASHRQALRQFRDPATGGQASALNELGLVQQLTGDYPAAAASHQQALSCTATSATGRPGRSAEQPRRTTVPDRASQQARDHHSQALALARELGAPLEEARALEGTGHSHLHGRQRPRRHRLPPAGTRHLPAHRCPRGPARPGNPRRSSRRNRQPAPRADALTTASMRTSP